MPHYDNIYRGTNSPISKEAKRLKLAIKAWVYNQDIKLYSEGKEAVGRVKCDTVKCQTGGNKFGSWQPADGQNRPLFQLVEEMCVFWEGSVYYKWTKLDVSAVSHF